MQGNEDSRTGRRAAAVGLAFLLNACAGTGPAAEALLAPEQGNFTTGRAVFEQRAQGTRLIAYTAGLGTGLHSLHVHEEADCGASVAAGISSLSTAEADAYGNAEFVAVLPGLTLQGHGSIVGKGISVRNALGVRVACGVIVQRQSHARLDSAVSVS